MSFFTARTIFRVLPVVALTIAAGLVVILARQNQSLRSQQLELLEQVRFPQPGVYVPVFNALTLRGDTTTVGSHPDPAGSQLLFFFNTRCPYCQQSMPAWNDLFTRLRGNGGTEVLGIGLDSLHLLEVYAHDQELGFPLISLLDRRLAELYRVRAVPLTVLVDADGHVAYARRGVLEVGEQVDSVLLAIGALRTRAEQEGSAAEDQPEEGMR